MRKLLQNYRLVSAREVAKEVVRSGQILDIFEGRTERMGLQIDVIICQFIKSVFKFYFLILKKSEQGKQTAVLL